MADDLTKVDKFKNATASAVKALSEQHELNITFSGKDMFQGENEIVLPEPTDETDNRLRGLADSIALKLKYHDADLHQKFAPPDNEYKAIFDAIEQSRYEALGASKMAGVSENLSNLHDVQIQAQGDTLPLHEIWRMASFAAFSNGTLNEKVKKSIPVSLEALSGLKQYLNDQQNFYEHLRDFMQNLGFDAMPENEAKNPSAGDEEDTSGNTAPNDTSDDTGADQKEGEAPPLEADGEQMPMTASMKMTAKIKHPVCRIMPVTFWKKQDRCQPIGSIQQLLTKLFRLKTYAKILN